MQSSAESSLSQPVKSMLIAVDPGSSLPRYLNVNFNNSLDPNNPSPNSAAVNVILLSATSSGMLI